MGQVWEGREKSRDGGTSEIDFTEFVFNRNIMNCTMDTLMKDTCQ